MVNLGSAPQDHGATTLDSQTQEHSMPGREQLVRWLRQVYATQQAELDCERCQSLLPAYVEHELDGNGQDFPLMRGHLDQCPDCADVYDGLRAVLELEAQGRLPQVDESLETFASDSEPSSAPEFVQSRF
jgi:hypothetical protein